MSSLSSGQCAAEACITNLGVTRVDDNKADARWLLALAIKREEVWFSILGADGRDPLGEDAEERAEATSGRQR